MNTYDPALCVAFRKTAEEWGGLSNMCPGYPIGILGEIVATSESLYQAFRFPAQPELQRTILGTRNPMKAKMSTKPHRHLTRSDWETGGVRVVVMRWALRVKLLQNKPKFGALLCATGDRPIVEDSHKDRFWGAVLNGEGMLVGENVLGTLLVELREDLRLNGAPSQVEPPDIPDCTLLGKPVPTLYH
jgi:ribA/ribD-fused uncharacterized protein